MNPELRARIQLELAEMTKILDQIDQFVVHLTCIIHQAGETPALPLFPVLLSRCGHLAR